MGKIDFFTQEATEDILFRVTSVCAECYSDISVGDTIYYDMQDYRYLCKCCQEKFVKAHSSSMDIDETIGLF